MAGKGSDTSARVKRTSQEVETTRNKGSEEQGEGQQGVQQGTWEVSMEDLNNRITNKTLGKEFIIMLAVKGRYFILVPQQLGP